MKAEGYRHDVRFQVLGPVQVTIDGEELALGGPQQRLVLALLISANGRAVSTGQLIDGVWGEDVPTTARKALQGYVHHLRTQIGEALRTESNGYSLVTDGEVDAVEFQRLHAEAKELAEVDPARVAELLRDALGLWNGPAYADVRDALALAPEVARLDDLRIAALGDRIDADLALGQHVAVVGELEGLTYEFPLQERFRAQYMTALYRAGRQVEALRAYEKFRRYLLEELGLDPSAELRRLENQILTGDEALQGPEAVPGTGLTGVRGYELRELIGSHPSRDVYRGYQRSVGRQVLVRVLGREIADDPAFIADYLEDTKQIAALEHPNIGVVFDTWREPGRAYQVSRWLDGGTLADAVRDATLGPAAAVQVLDQIGGALGHAHRNGVAHGQLRPSKVLFDDIGNAYLTDFAVGPSQIPRSAESDRLDFSAMAHLVLAGLGAAREAGHLRADLAGTDLPAGVQDVFEIAFSDEPYVRVDDFLRALRQAMGVDAVAPGAAPTFVEARNPYKGLQAFQEADADDFFGRDELIDRLVHQIERHRLVAVVGPSGSGKSSAVRAGLVPRLRATNDGRVRLLTEMYPGAYPFEELEGALLRVGVERTSVIEDLIGDDRGLIRVLKQILPSDDAELVLFVDQFEELFSVVGSEDTRQLFLANLVRAAADPRSQLRIVVTMRADFFDRPLSYPGFGEVFEAGLVPVTVPDDDQLAQAIAEPARSVGVEFEDGLVPQIVRDVSGQPGGLPLLQYSLTELFESRDSNTLTLAAYQRGGGVFGALGRRAEALYQDLDDPQGHAIREAFLRMVTVDEGADDLRRRVRRVDLNTADVDDTALSGALQAYGAHRLLTFDRDPVTRGPTVEVAHEALLREWPRLGNWIDGQRDDLVTRRRLDVGLEEWRQSGEDPSYLPSGGRLAQFEEWATTTTLSMSGHERHYLEAGVEREAGAKRKSARRRRIGVMGLAVVTGLLAILAAFALTQRRSAVESAAEAETRRIAAEAVARADTDPQLALLLAAEAYHRDPGIGGMSALQRVMLRTGSFVAVIGQPENQYLDVQWAGGSTVVAAHTGGLQVYSADTLELIHSLDVAVRSDRYSRAEAAAPRAALDVTADGRWAAVATTDTSVVLFDIVGGDSYELAHDGPVYALAFSNDSTRLATGEASGRVQIWSVDDRSVKFSIDAHLESVRDFAVELDARGAPVSVMEEFGAVQRRGVAALTFTTDDSMLVSGEMPLIRVWNPVNGELVREFFALWEGFAGLTPATHWTLPLNEFEVTPSDPSILRVGGRNHLLTYDLSSGEMLRQVWAPTDDQTIITTLAGSALLPSGNWLVALSDGRIRLLDDEDAPVNTIASGLTFPGDIDLSPNGLLAASGDGGVLVVALDGRTLLSDTVPAMGTTASLSVSATGDLVAQATALPDLSPGPTNVHQRLDLGFSRLSTDIVGNAEIHSLPDGRTLFSTVEWDPSVGEAHENWRMTLFEAPSGQPFGITGPAQAFGWSISPDGQWFASDSYGRVFVWDLQTGEVIANLQELAPSGEIRSISFNADGSRLIATARPGGYKIWDTATWTTTSTSVNLGDPRVAGYSPDGRYLATIAPDGDVVIRDSNSLEVIRIMTGAGPPEDLGGHIDWSADGRYLVTRYEDVGRLWDLESGQQIGDPFPNATGETPAGATGDVPQLATLVDDHIHVWNLNVDTWSDVACRVAGRNMTAAEWEQFGPAGEPYRATCRQYGLEPPPG